jgi:hypothetical protein
MPIKDTDTEGIKSSLILGSYKKGKAAHGMVRLASTFMPIKDTEGIK